MWQKAMMKLSYANNIGVRLARWERDSNSERATQTKGSTRYVRRVYVCECECEGGVQIIGLLYVLCGLT